MSNANFANILSKKVEETERPKPIPAGNYVFAILEHEFGESAKKKTPYVRFWCRPMAPMADVDQSILPPTWQEKKMKLDFYLTDDAMFMLREFLEKTLGMSTSGMAYSDLIPATTGQNFVGQVGHEISGDNIYANIVAHTNANQSQG